MNLALQEIVANELKPLGLDLFELRSGGTKTRPVLDVRIDRTNGQNVTVEDCARASRAIEARLDAGNTVGTRYVLEVSSPGLERPLRNAADWRRFVGRHAVVAAESVSGAFEVKIAGVEGPAGEEIVVVEEKSGTTHRLPLASVSKARLAFNWNR